ncbi:MAG: carboxypeptidase regulatory-like domain-containing protein [Bryobacteraceae bacterium]
MALCAALVPAVFSQQTMDNASVSGRVLDPSGAVMQNARVSVRQIDTGVASSAVTDRDGRFRFPYLRVGRYEIEARGAGFSDVSQHLTLMVGSAFDLSITLPLASGSTKITVTEQATTLETTRAQIAGTVSQNEIKQLPLNGRNFLDVALLIPGVSTTNTGSNQLFAETSAVPGQGISINSQRNFSNSFIVDGLSNNDDAAGLTGPLYSVDVVNELQVVTSGAQAEFGRALGGYVNFVTKSGTNAVHGDLYGYLRNSRFNAANPLSHQALPLTQAQYGASIGGPLVRDRTFYFANFERRDLNQSGLVTISPANVSLINSRLQASGYSGSLISTGLYPNPVHTTNLFGKVDHEFSANDQFSARYSVYDVSSRNARGAGALNAATASANLYDTDQVVAFSNIETLSPRLVNETRGQFWNSSFEAPPSDPIGPAVSIAGVASFGTLSGSPTARTNRLGEVVDNLSYQKGGHALRFGTEFLFNDDTITFPRSIRGSYTFSSLANFLSGVYNNQGYTQTFANSLVAQTNPNLGFYSQDEWKLNDRLTFNVGIRYDLQFLKGISTDTNNVSPRAGFAWTPFASRRTVIRGGFGIFYDRLPLRALANALLSANNSTDAASLSQISLTLSPAQTGAPVFPNRLSTLTVPAGVLFNFTTMQPDLQNAYSEAGNIDIEHQLGKSSTVEVGYEHVRGLHLIASINRNVPGCVASGSNNGCRPDPRYGNNSQYSSLADSRYDGLHVSFVQRPATWGNYRVSYTFSKALDNVGEFFFSSPLTNFNIWQDYGRSDDDQRHRIVFDGSIHTPQTNASTFWGHVSQGFELTGLVQYYSSLPLNLTAGSTTVQGTAARPMINGGYIGRNVGTGADSLNLSGRLTRIFQLTDRLRLQVMAEGFNLTNHVNAINLNGVFGTGRYPNNPASNFRQITAVSDPRTFQFGLRLAF